MIAKINGKLDYIHDNFAVITVGGIGYKVSVSSYTLGKIALMENIELYTYTHVREDVLALYGFITRDELEMFELLISISGIGPKAGLSILSIADPNTIAAAIANEDHTILTKVSGVGKKTAERVILELKNKIGTISHSAKGAVVGDSDALEALSAMGYSISEARDALKLVSKDVTDIGERVKQALRNMGKK